MRRIVHWYETLPRWSRHVLDAISTAVPFYAAALLSYLVADVASLGGAFLVTVHAIAFVFLLTLVVFVKRYIAGVLELIRDEQEQRRATTAHAYTHVDRCVTRDFLRLRHDVGGENFVCSLVTCVDRLKHLVEATYATFEAAYGTAAASESRIDFEVTFMTKSYLDGEIFIPAYANREGRAPRSLVLRQQRADIYSNTVTAMIYREDRPTVHIIEDTSVPAVQYQALYPNQLERIRSSIVFPVLSEANELLGTLVVHCDRRNFFKLENLKYWSDLLEVFAKRLALEKAKLDRVVALHRKNAMQNITLPGPPF